MRSGAGSQIWDDAKPGLGAEITGVLLSILKHASKQQTTGSPHVKKMWGDGIEPPLLRNTSLLQSQFINMMEDCCEATEMNKMNNWKKKKKKE